MAKSGEYQIQLTGPGIAIERPISADIAQRIAVLLFTDGKSEALINAPQPSLTALPSRSVEVPPIAHMSQSLREFMMDCGPTRLPEKVVTIGYYLEKNGQSSGFSKQDLIRGFEQAKEPIPGNLARDVTWTIKIGWIAAKHENEDVFYVTKSGAAAVESKFPPELRKKTRASEGGRRRKPAAKKATQRKS